MRSYRPPALSSRVTILNPTRSPEKVLDSFGNVSTTGDEPAGYRMEVYANVRDRVSRDEVGEEGPISTLTTIFTIRYRDPAPDAECVVHFGDLVYKAVGPPVERGGVNGNRASRYFEIHTERSK